MKRARDLEARNQSAGRICQKRYGTGKCGGILEAITIAGRTEMSCPWCERQRQRICRDCPRSVEGNGPLALRCAEHKELSRAAQIRKSGEKHRDTINRRARAAYSDPDVRRRRNEYKRAYRRAHPEKVKEWKRAYVMKHGGDQRSTYLDYHRRYNAQTSRAVRKREQATAVYYRDNPVRPDPKCQHCGTAIEWIPLAGGRAGRPAKNCDRCCTKVELARRVARRAEAGSRGVPLNFTPFPVGFKPIRVKRPMPAPFAETGERLCVDCKDIVVTGRKKKCSKCRAQEVELARQKLEAHQGRGRRTDIGGAAPHRKPGPKPQPIIVAAPIDSPRNKRAVVAPTSSPWLASLERGLTTWQMAEESGITEAAVRDQLRIAGGDLLSRAFSNNTKAEKAKRSIAAASSWAKPRVAVAGAA